MDTRESLLKAASAVFARKGFDGATVKELAEEAGVNVSLVSYHFGGKDGLYKACLEQFGRERLTSAERVLKAPSSREDFRARLTLFVEEFITTHIEDPNISMVMHRECTFETPLMKGLFKEVFAKAFEKIVDFFKAGQKARFLREDVDCEISAGLFMGALLGVITRDKASKEFFGKTITDRKYRDRVVEHLVRNLMEGIVL